MTITYLTGDATEPVGPGLKIIPHICNDMGAWGAGFVLAISKKWKNPETHYRSMTVRHLGDISIHVVESDIVVVNIIGQHGITRSKLGTPPIRYKAVRKALKHINSIIEPYATLHMPRIGCGLAGGKWEKIEKIIKDTITVDVYVYDLPVTH